MHKHDFIFGLNGDAICSDPSCKYSFSREEIKKILSNIANKDEGEEECLHHRAWDDKDGLRCMYCGKLLIPKG